MLNAWMKNWKFWAWVIGILLVLSVETYVVSNLIQYEKELATAKEKEKVAELARQQQEQRQKELNDSVLTMQKAFLELASQQQALAKTYQDRERKLAQQLQDVTKPKSVEDIIGDVKAILGSTAEKAAENAVTLPAAQVQILLASKVENDALKLQIENVKQQLILEQQKSNSLKESLDRALLVIDEDKKLIAEYRDVVASYKKAAVKSKWKRALEFAKPIALGLVVGVVAGQIVK